MSGFADWQSIVQWLGPALLPWTFFNFPGPAGTQAVMPQTPLGNYQGVLVIVNAFGSEMWPIVTSAVTPGPVNIESRKLFLPFNNVTSWVVPVTGQLVTVEMDCQTVPTSAFVAVFPTNLPAGIVGYRVGLGAFPDNPRINQQPTAAIAPAANLDLDPIAFYGLAELWLQTLGQPMTLAVQQLNNAGAIIGTVWQNAYAAGVQDNVQMYFPVGRNRLRITNTGAANDAVNVTLTQALPL